MRSSDDAELPDLERDLPTTREDIAVLRKLWLGEPGKNLLPELVRLDRAFPQVAPSRRTSEGWEPFTLE